MNALLRIATESISEFSAFSSSVLPSVARIAAVEAARRHCSQTAVKERDPGTGGDQNHGGGEGDVDKVCRTILDNRNPNLEKILDQEELKLTSHLVVQVLRKLRFEEKIALRFFSWAGNQQRYAHEADAYNEMIDILSSTKYKVKQFQIVCCMLDYAKRHGGDVIPIENLIKVLRNYTEKHLTHLHKFVKKKKIRVRTQPEVNAMNLLLDALCKCSMVDSAETLFQRLKKTIHPDYNTYSILFFGWCRARNPTRGMKILDQMIQAGHDPDNFTYNTAIDAFCKEGMVDEATRLFDFVRTRGSTLSSPTAKTYVTIILGLVQNNRMDQCFQLLGEMKNNGCLPDVSTFKDVIEALCVADKVEHAYTFLEEMGGKGYPLDIVTFNCFLKVLCDVKNKEEALKLYQRMMEMGCSPSAQTYNMLISLSFQMGDPDGAVDTWREMNQSSCAPDVDSYCVMIDGLFHCNKPEEACCLIEDVIRAGIKLPYKQFDAFLLHLSAIGDLQAIHHLSHHMNRFYNRSFGRRVALNDKRRSLRFRSN